MGNLLNIITPLHTSTKRNYLERMNNDKVACMEIAKKYGAEFWDGDRRYGYGGYRYDGRQKIIARKLIERYTLKDNPNILDVGCGKGFLLHEFKQILPGSEIAGFDISDYAIKNSKEEVMENLFVHDAKEEYPFEDKSFDLVTSITTLHNLQGRDLKKALQEIERVGKNKYIVVESFRNEKELFNLQCWALTCASFFTPEGWNWMFDEAGYTGDYEFIYFE